MLCCANPASVLSVAEDVIHKAILDRRYNRQAGASRRIGEAMFPLERVVRPEGFLLIAHHGRCGKPATGAMHGQPCMVSADASTLPYSSQLCNVAVQMDCTWFCP